MFRNYILKPWYSKQVRQTLFCSLYRIIHYVKCNMLSKSSKWELDFVHYIAKFTISRFVISRFECTAVLQWGALPLTFKTYTSWFIVPPRSIIEASLVVKRKIYNKVYFYFGHNNAAMTIKQKKNLDIE